MKPARILLLVVALVAGGLAAYLATRGNSPQSVVVEAARAPSLDTKILVSTGTIAVGQRLSAKLVEWQEWPESALRPEYITVAAIPDAPDQLTGTIARFEIFPGEPIRESKLVRADQGYLSAVLPKGMRAVSLPVNAQSSAGGFIVPNDHVDVVRTLNGGQGLRSETILQNVKVIAIGLRLGEKTSTSGGSEEEGAPPPVFQSATIATLELDPIQAETIIGAASEGELSLVLRSVADFSESVEALTSRDSQSVRMIRFGVETAVSSASSGPAQSPAMISNAAIETVSAPVFSEMGASNPIATVNETVPLDPVQVQ